ncbi:hypothetical protein FOYG_07667 [Fusarium oxysporum NRRL 32931]|uniref:Uncharacterized protein n=1 Tax=Fusarium oxysporum NRRL 32931 TaxID=660029 RepID=W9I5Z3_FUSOX|nr:hypothetical protein FOYG_07667 [Fusarium oxysporum NRRL 32931]EWY90037.1 hypothetical protein FOYG_07667 [Fusarium oxysporum NRRL 32931]
MIPLLGSEHQGFLFFGPVPSWATQSLQGRDVEGSRFLFLSWDLRFIGLARFSRLVLNALFSFCRAIPRCLCGPGLFWHVNALSLHFFNITASTYWHNTVCKPGDSRSGN